MNAAERGVVKDVEEALSHGVNTECTDRVSKSLLYTNHYENTCLIVHVISILCVIK